MVPVGAVQRPCSRDNSAGLLLPHASAYCVSTGRFSQSNLLHFGFLPCCPAAVSSLCPIRGSFPALRQTHPSDMAPAKGAGGGVAGSPRHRTLRRFILADPRPGRSVLAVAAAFSPDSFYDFEAQGYKAQHTPAEIRVRSGQRERAGRVGVLLCNIPPAWQGMLGFAGSASEREGLRGDPHKPEPDSSRRKGETKRGQS